MPPAQAAASPSAAIAAGPRLEERPEIEAIAPRQGREVPSAVVEVGAMIVLAARAVVRGLRGPYDYMQEFVMQFRFVLTLALLPVPVIPPGTGAPPCVTQGPWEFNGLSRYFPRLQPAKP